jgi:hypothetical protein
MLKVVVRRINANTTAAVTPTSSAQNTMPIPLSAPSVRQYNARNNPTSQFVQTMKISSRSVFTELGSTTENIALESATWWPSSRRQAVR